MILKNIDNTIQIDSIKNNFVKIVLITQDSLRHKNFIFRLKEEFPKNIFSVIIYKPKKKVTKRSKIFKIKNLIKNILVFNEYLANRKFRKDFAQSEKRIFSKVNNQFKNLRLSHIQFNDIKKLEELLLKLKPDLLLSLGGPLISKKALNCVNLLSINQHAGISPNYKGNYTTFWPLFHRDVSSIGSTIHITETGADSGPILKVARTTLDCTDTPCSIFHKTVCLGTELMVDVIKKLLKGEKLPYNVQNPMIGKTYLSKNFTNFHKMLIYRDWESGWLNNYLKNKFLF